MITVYVAHPLEAKDAPKGSVWASMADNYQRYLEICAALSNAGFAVFSWAHHYEMHTRGLTAGDANFYLKRDEAILREADIFLLAGPTEFSSGMRFELDCARNEGLKIVHAEALREFHITDHTEWLRHLVEVL
jgi:hypothetical protein